MDIDELSENFELLDDWEDKYRYLIDLGEKLPPFAEECRTDEWKVSGCQSQVWLVPSFVREGNDVRLHFAGDSDAAIVRGLIAVVLTAFDGSFSTVEISAVPVISAEARVNAHPLILQPDVCNSLALSASISNSMLYGASNVFSES